MTPTPFTDAAAAIDEAMFLALTYGTAYVLVDVDGETIQVIPQSKAAGLDVLEVVNP